MEAIDIRLEANACRLEAIDIRLESVACRLEAIACRLEAIDIRLQAIACAWFALVQELLKPCAEERALQAKRSARLSFL